MPDETLNENVFVLCFFLRIFGVKTEAEEEETGVHYFVKILFYEDPKNFGGDFYLLQGGGP
jgi:hypothetical protein